jgi:hypothetical protein
VHQVTSGPLCLHHLRKYKMALVLENGVWKLQADGTGPTSTTIWSVDFSTVSDHNFMSTSTLSLGGVTFTAENASATYATQFQVDSGVLKIEPKVGNSYLNGTFTAPQLSAQWADLMAYGASGAYNTEKRYVWRWIFSSAVTLSGGESHYGGALGGIRTDRTTINKDLGFQLSQWGYWAFQKGASQDKTVNSSSTSITGSYRSQAISYGNGSFAALASQSTEKDVAFGGLPIWTGYTTAADTNEGFRKLTAPPDTLDLSNSGAQAYVGAYWATGGSTTITSIERLELHEVG